MEYPEIVKSKILASQRKFRLSTGEVQISNSIDVDYYFFNPISPVKTSSNFHLYNFVWKNKRHWIH